MATTYTVTEYSKEDLEELLEMSNEDVLHGLEEIKRGWMPQGYYGISDDEYKTYDEDYYRCARIHIAMSKAMDLVHKAMVDEQ